MEKDCCTTTVESGNEPKLVTNEKAVKPQKQEPAKKPKIIDPQKQLLEDLKLEQSELH